MNWKKIFAAWLSVSPNYFYTDKFLLESEMMIEEPKKCPKDDPAVEKRDKQP